MLTCHRAARGDLLADGLAELLRRPASPDPFLPEIVSVPTRGVERWLTQRLGAVLGAGDGRGDGVCANVAFPFPATVVDAATAAGTGIGPDDDPWVPERAAWALLAVVEAELERPWLAQLARHIGRIDPTRPDPSRCHRRLAVVRRIADRFDRYGVHRPDMIRAWADGQSTDAVGGPIAAAAAWQPELWRHLRDHLGRPSPAERLPEACAALRGAPGLVDLPDRLSLFGLTRLPASHLEVLAALGAAREVHLWLLHPSADLWDRVAARTSPPVPVPLRTRETDPTVELAEHPLLRSWGRDVRELQLVVAAAGALDVGATPWPEEGAAPTLLRRIQADLRANRPPAGGHVLSPEDRSLQVHACHGRARQVQVLRDALLHVLADDPTIEPRDVVVMCPDVEEFAPLIQATFGEGSGARLPVRLADRSLRQTNPVLSAVSILLDLAEGRVSASRVLDLVGTAPVRRRFDLDDDAVARIDSWIRASGVRWGLDATSRTAWVGAPLADGTWDAGLGRILVGAAMSEDGLPLPGGVLPLDDVDASEVELAGRLAELLERLRSIVEACAEPADIGTWTVRLAAAADALLDVAETDRWQRDQLGALLDEVAEAAASGPTPAVGLGEVRALLADRLRGRPTRANFRTGQLTVCTLVPMRSVPHRVVCLLGLDDGTFPRRSPEDGDDLLLSAPCVGDRDPRSEDRQLLLDALLAAGDHLIITYSGNDERTNAARPPCVPVGELLDVVDRTTSATGERAVSRSLVAHHPLQAFDRRNFVAVPDRDGAAPTPWSFDRVALDGALALARTGPSPAEADPALPAPGALVEVRLEDLVAFVQRPADAYLRQTLGIRAPWEDAEADDALPLALGPLDEWRIGDRLLQAVRRGVELDDAARAELARGTLPPGRLAHPVLQRITERVRTIAAAAGPVGTGQAQIDVMVGATLLTGTVEGLGHHELVGAVYGRPGPQHRLASWVRWLALEAADPDHDWSARLVGRGYRDAVATWVVTAGRDTPLARAADATAALRRLLDLFESGRREPLPLAARTSVGWAEARAAGRDPEAATRRVWSGELGEADHAAHVTAWGRVLSFEELLAARPGPSETGPGWESEEQTRFGRLSRRLADGLLLAERRA